MTMLLRAIGLALLAAGCAPDNGSAPAEDTGSVEQGGASAPASPPGPGDESERDTSAHPASPSLRVSQFISLDDCRVIVSKPDEAGYTSSACPGAGGCALRLIDADARQNLFVRAPDGTERSLALSEAAGGGFSRIGERIEWRGTANRSGFHPDAMVLRYFVVGAEGAEEVAYLLPVSLRNGGPCVAARIAPGEGQSDRAREWVDGEMRCLRSSGR